MVNARQAAEGKYLKPEHIQKSQNKVAVITDEGEYQDSNWGKQLMLGIQFNKLSKVLRLNQRSAQALVNAYGEDTTDWVGQKIVLGVVDISGKDSIVAKPEGDNSVDEEEVQQGEENGEN